MASKEINVIFEFPNGPILAKVSEEKAFNLLRSLAGVGEPRKELVINKTPPIPETEELENIIKSNPDYLFSNNDITDRFLENVNIDTKEKTRWMNATKVKMSRIRKKIEENENGKWIKVNVGSKKMFKFIKTQNDEPEVTNELSEALNDWV